MIQLLDVATIMAGGLLAGNELAVAAFVHPTFNRLSDDVHVQSAAALAGLLGRVMPFWYGLSIVLTSSGAFLRWHESGHWPLLIALSAFLSLLAIVYTVALLVPINDRIARWTKSDRPSNWKALRKKWDVLHRWRVLLLMIAFTLLLVGVPNCP